jgi:hypothetical protein
MTRNIRDAGIASSIQDGLPVRVDGKDFSLPAEEHVLNNGPAQRTFLFTGPDQGNGFGVKHSIDAIHGW